MEERIEFKAPQMKYISDQMNNLREKYTDEMVSLSEEEYKACSDTILELYKWRFTSIWILSIMYSALIAVGLEIHIIALVYAFGLILLFYLIECHLRRRQYKHMSISLVLGEESTQERAGLWKAYLVLKEKELAKKPHGLRDKIKYKLFATSTFNWYYIGIAIANVVLLTMVFIIQYIIT